MKKQLFICFAALLLAAGCASMKDFFALPEVDTSRSFQASYERVWHAAVHAVGEQGLRVTTLDKDSGFIQTAYKNTDAKTIFQYAATSGLQYTTCRYMVSVTVTQEDNGVVSVSVSLSAEGYTANNPDDFAARKNMYWRTLQSDKLMERDILNAISAQLPASAQIPAQEPAH